MKKNYFINLVSLGCLITAVCIICYILREDEVLPFSIQSVWAYFMHWSGRLHVLAVGLLPIYVSLMIFGTAIMGIYLGSILKKCLIYFFQLIK